ncbi:MAG: NUDIX hydrolase [Planctomycetota bacterium]
MTPEPPRMCVTGDTIPVRYRRGSGLQVLLVRRGNPPFEGQWALPGGFVEMDEDLPDAARRELREETGATPRLLIQVGAWGTPGRDPRGRTVTAAYLAVIGPTDQAVEGADDAAAAEWHPREDLPELAFDHRDIVTTALLQLDHYCAETALCLAMLEHQFHRDELEELLSHLQGAPSADDMLESLLERQLIQEAGDYPDSYHRLTDDFLEELDA